jgi:hypothetical protein
MCGGLEGCEGEDAGVDGADSAGMMEEGVRN